MKLRQLAYLLTLTATLTSCDPTPGGVLSPEPMAQLIADLEMGEAVIENDAGAFRNDSMRQVLRQSIYAKHGVTSAEVDSSLTWYGMHVEQYTKVYDRAGEILDKRLKESLSAGADEPTSLAITNQTTTADGDSVDVWQLDRNWRFSPGISPSQVITFALNRDRNFEPGDAYMLRFRTTGASAKIDAAIAAEYPEVTDYSSRRFSGTGWHTLSLPLDETRAVNRIYGSMTVSFATDKRTLFVDSISLIRMRGRKSRIISTADKHSIRR